MTISWIQAVILGIFACLASMPGMGGSAIGNYTLGRPLVAGLVCGIILGNVPAGIMVGAAMQVVYIALVTPGGTVSADVRAVSYIGIPLAMLALNSYGLDPASTKGVAMATSFGAMVGTLGTVFFLRNSNNQPCMAAYRMESCRKRRIQEIISCRYGITLDFSFNL